jgi:cobalt-zinc-cadmium efflux system membrane fusion protein
MISKDERTAAIWAFFALLASAVVAVESQNAVPKSEPERTESQSIWTDKGELFMEFRPPVAGQKARFTAHLTELATFHAVVKARVVLHLERSGISPLKANAENPSKPGIFQPEVVFTESGDYRGQLIVSGADLNETFALETIHVTREGDLLPSVPAKAPPQGQEISFLKEQQWKIPFRTVLVRRRNLVQPVQALGRVREVPGNSVSVSSPVVGRVVSVPPIVGHSVKSGEVLLTIAPLLAPDLDRPHLDQEVQTASAELAQARSTVSRIGSLVENEALPRKELVAARTQLAIAQSKMTSAQAHRQAYAFAQQRDTTPAPEGQFFQLRSPIDGEIVRVDCARGEIVRREKDLFEVDDLSRVWIEGQVFEPDLLEVRGATGAVFRFPGREKPLSLTELSGSIVHVGHHVDAESRTARVLFEVKNPDELIPINGFVEIDILTRRSGDYLAVPVDAIQEEGRRNVVYVQTEGETFEKRDVTLGVHDRDYIAVLSGVKAGERVTTTGAYEIKLSTLSGAIPEHGHTH